MVISGIVDFKKEISWPGQVPGNSYLGCILFLGRPKRLEVMRGFLSLLETYFQALEKRETLWIIHNVECDNSYMYHLDS
jgi:hypothetical protein